VLDPSKRFITVVLALGILVLAVAIAVGERAGDRVMGQVSEKRLDSIAPVTVTPAPSPTNTSTSPYGADWKRTQVMAAATDPGFPDPRVPPQPLPTLAPAAKRGAKPIPTGGATPTPTPTPNLNIPIWRRNAPLPTATPVSTPTPVPGPSLQPNGEPQGEPTP
jgi:hypothetical protein